MMSVAQTWIEDAKHWYAAIRDRDTADELMRADSIKMLEGMYLDFCKALGLDPDRQEHRRLAWTMAFVGLRVADSKFKQYLKQKNWEAQQGFVSENGAQT